MKPVSVASSTKPRAFHGYTILVAAILIQAVGWGILSSAGVFFKPMQTDMGWSRTIVSVAASLTSFVIGVMSIVVGNLNDRFGPKIVMVCCGLIVGLSQIMTSQVGVPWHLYIAAAMMGVGGSAIDVVILSTIARWFVRRRSTFSGFAKAGTGLGMFLMPLLAGVLIEAYDWRVAIAVLGVLVIVGIVPVAFLLKRDPAQVGEVPDGENAVPSVKASPEKSLTLRQVVHTWQFWTVCGFYFTTVFIAQTMIAHIALHATDLGIATTTAASVISAIGIASISGRFLMGSAGDRIGGKKAMMVCSVVVLVALSWLQLADKLWMLYLFAAVYGFGHGGFFAIISPLVASLFGTRAHGTVLGIIIFSGMMGGTVGPFLTGFLFDEMGSYRLAFLIMIAIGAIGLALTALLKPVRIEKEPATTK